MMYNLFSSRPSCNIFLRHLHVVLKRAHLYSCHTGQNPQGSDEGCALHECPFQQFLQIPLLNWASTIFFQPTTASGGMMLTERLAQSCTTSSGARVLSVPAYMKVLALLALAAVMAAPSASHASVDVPNRTAQGGTWLNPLIERLEVVVKSRICYERVGDIEVVKM